MKEPIFHKTFPVTQLWLDAISSEIFLDTCYKLPDMHLFVKI